MRYTIIYICIINFLFGFEFDLSLGNAYNSKSLVSIQSESEQASGFHVEQSAQTHGFRSPQYYSIRFRKDRYELELVHHKLYFEDDLPDGIDHLEVTDGYNLLMLNILSPINPESFHNSLYYRIGIGTVVAHPDITINENRYYNKGGGLIPTVWTSGYHWGGMSSQGSLLFKKNINENLSYHIETKLIYAITVLSLDEDEYDWKVEIPNLSIHFLGGISFGK